MKNRLWMLPIAVAALSLAACGEDANGGDEMAEMTETAETMADDAMNGAADGSGATSQELPEGVTRAMVAQGKTVFEGAGICATCHGAAGEGVPNLGGDLTDGEWLHSDGSYQAIVGTIMNGVPPEASSSGIPMPPKGGTNISDEQVRAAAAYVWTLSK